MIEKKEYEDPFEKEPCASCKSKWINVMDGGGYYCVKYDYDVEKCNKVREYSTMTLDEAIKHYEEYIQLAEWLKELKRYRENE